MKSLFYTSLFLLIASFCGATPIDSTDRALDAPQEGKLVVLYDATTFSVDENVALLQMLNIEKKGEFVLDEQESISGLEFSCKLNNDQKAEIARQVSLMEGVFLVEVVAEQNMHKKRG